MTGVHNRTLLLHANSSSLALNRVRAEIYPCGNPRCERPSSPRRTDECTVICTARAASGNSFEKIGSNFFFQNDSFSVLKPLVMKIV